MMMKSFQVLLILIYQYIVVSSGEDYYELLGVSKTADNREIRKAFKKLAVALHPDKNVDDPDAHDKFVKITKAYEILKDEETRKKYDLYGDDGLKESGHKTQYRSWNYYNENFGIYDDDPEIITLSQNEFDQVFESDDIWFINFYSPMCGHCHKIAPEWRKMARELEGVIRIGAVNCEDDWFLCSQHGINVIPFLMIYPKGTRYHGGHTAKEMVEYVLSILSVDILHVDENNFETLKKQKSRPLVVFFCDENENCPSKQTRIKVAAILNNLVSVAVVDCVTNSELCENLDIAFGTVYFKPGELSKEGAHKVDSYEAKEIADAVLSFLPDATELNEEAFQDIVTRLKLGDGDSWLVYFYIGEARNNLEMKKIPALLPTMKIGRVNCGRHRFLCEDLHIQKYPVFAVFKRGGGYEFHHGRETAHDVAKFARESGASVNLRILTPKEFPNVLEDGSVWFVDFFAPWCPPCMKFLPEFRKASRMVDFVNFGTVDCTIHVHLCRQYNIKSYPTTILYNNSKPHHFYGSHTLEKIVEFVEDMQNPPGNGRGAMKIDKITT